MSYTFYCSVPIGVQNKPGGRHEAAQHRTPVLRYRDDGIRQEGKGNHQLN